MGQMSLACNKNGLAYFSLFSGDGRQGISSAAPEHCRYTMSEIHLLVAGSCSSRGPGPAVKNGRLSAIIFGSSRVCSSSTVWQSPRVRWVLLKFYDHSWQKSKKGRGFPGQVNFRICYPFRFGTMAEGAIHHCCGGFSRVVRWCGFCR